MVSRSVSEHVLFSDARSHFSCHLESRGSEAYVWSHSLTQRTHSKLSVFSLCCVDHTRNTGTIEKSALLVHPSVLENDKIENLDEKLDAMMAFYDKTNVEDLVACERVQLGIESDMYEGGRYSYKYEETIHRFQNMLLDHITGEPRIPAGDESGSIGRSWQRT